MIVVEKRPLRTIYALAGHCVIVISAFIPTYLDSYGSHVEP